MKTFMVVSSLFLIFVSQGLAGEFTDDFETAHDYLTEGVTGTGWDGFIGLGDRESVDNLNANMDRTGELYIQSRNGRWQDPFPPVGDYNFGPLLYKNVTGDFIAIVEVTEYQSGVSYNAGGLMARVANDADAGAGEDWVATTYFPMYSVNNKMDSTNNGIRTEVDPWQASVHPYLMLERDGDDFYGFVSDDGVSWTYPLNNGNPVSRTDMTGLPVQVGIWQCTYIDTQGYMAFDNFSLTYGDLQYARNPNPTIGDDDVSVNVELSWTPGDNVQDVNGHQLFIGTVEQDVNDATVASHPNVDLYIVSDPVCQVAQLDTNQPYHWRVDEVNDATTWKGEVWNFTTETGKAKEPFPTDGYVSAPNDIILSWTASGVAGSHDVYFGTDGNDVNDANRTNPLGVLKSQGQGGTTYNPGPLGEKVTYYWRIDEVNDTNMWKGDTWSFTTVQTTGYYFWPEYNPTLAYDYFDEYGEISIPTQYAPDGVTGIAGTYTDGWWTFRWGPDKNDEVTEGAWIPMLERFNEDFDYITNVMRWPRDKRVLEGYYSTVYLYGSSLSTDNAPNDVGGGWQGTYGGYPAVIASYIPVAAFDPNSSLYDPWQQGAMIHEGIHCILSSMPGCFNSCWFHEGGNTWLQGTMEAQQSGNFSGMGWLSAGAAIAPFMPIECYSGWLLDGSFGGPCAQGNPGGGTCYWRNLLGGTQYGECFAHGIEVILGPKSIAWIWRNAHYSGRVLQDMAEAPGGLGDAQTRRVIKEFRARQAFGDFGQWSYAYRQLLNNNWNLKIEEEFSPYSQDVDPWYATCYVDTTQDGSVLTPEARTLPGWSGANQIPLTVDSGATEAVVTFNPIGANMSCQLVYRDTSGNIHYGAPVSNGACSIPLANVRNNVIVAVICNTDYIYYGDSTRTAKYDYTLTMGAGVTGKANINTRWYDYNPSSYTITASAGANGIISPSGPVSVSAGSSQTFTFTPDPRYEVNEVILNGLPIGALNSYTFNNVRGNHSISVTFVESAEQPHYIGDLTGNGSVDGEDLEFLVNSWLAEGAGLTADLHKNGTIDFSDYAVFSGDWGKRGPVIVDIRYPQDGWLIPDGVVITIWIDAESVVGDIIKVEVFVNGYKLFEDTDGSDGWIYFWSEYNLGQYSMTARAWDDQGNMKTTYDINFEIVE